MHRVIGVKWGSIGIIGVKWGSIGIDDDDDDVGVIQGVERGYFGVM